ncbi:ATP phosphoribosyltransferase [Pseudohongiella spirulinae]|uniref:ATP phosphoribosyltransferase n=1 Tax=Pseudohongiella spirulinae TaxID=1249552 RepID=A0A0S2KF75_9GAMM|nr:ATP phosphoribosyltransferase [Pseudohongiella spirulinae]ALO46961.1 ATP phosphoribosyltransferase [Pseudohongiella spirulinae]
MTSSDNQPLVIALTKGRILEETMPLLSDAGIHLLEDPGKSRKLIFDTNLPAVRIMIVRGSDVPTYVEFGSADLGVVGKDLLMEYGEGAFYEPLDLGISRCRLMTAAPVGAPAPQGRVRVASKFVNIARRYFAEQGLQTDIIKLNGALELAPSMGLADWIVDIVDSGNTLKANGLEPLELIADISSRVIVNKASMKMKHASVSVLLDKLKVAASKRVQA